MILKIIRDKMNNKFKNRFIKKKGNRTRKKKDKSQKNDNSCFDFLIIFISFYSPKCIKRVRKIFNFLCNSEATRRPLKKTPTKP